MPRIISDNLAYQLTRSANRAAMTVVLGIGLTVAGESGFGEELPDILSEVATALTDSLENADDDDSRDRAATALELVRERLHA